MNTMNEISINEIKMIANNSHIIKELDKRISHMPLIKKIIIIKGLVNTFFEKFKELKNVPEELKKECESLGNNFPKYEACIEEKCTCGECLDFVELVGFGAIFYFSYVIDKYKN